jgi:hypothetical protein
MTEASNSVFIEIGSKRFDRARRRRDLPLERASWRYLPGDYAQERAGISGSTIALITKRGLLRCASHLVKNLSAGLGTKHVPIFTIGLKLAAKPPAILPISRVF